MVQKEIGLQSMMNVQVSCIRYFVSKSFYFNIAKLASSFHQFFSKRTSGFFPLSVLSFLSICVKFIVGLLFPIEVDLVSNCLSQFVCTSFIPRTYI